MANTNKPAWILVQIIILVLGIALVIISNQDFADNQCRSKTWARVLGILSIVGASISILILIIMLIADTGSPRRPTPLALPEPYHRVD